MNMRWLWVPALLMVMLAGCRQDPYMQVYIDSLNAEKRMLEDRVYELEYNYEQKLCELEASRQKPADDTDSSPSIRRDAQPTRPRPPRNGMPPGSPDLSPPTVEPGTPAGAAVRHSARRPQAAGPDGWASGRGGSVPGVPCRADPSSGPSRTRDSPCPPAAG